MSYSSSMWGGDRKGEVKDNTGQGGVARLSHDIGDIPETKGVGTKERSTCALLDKGRTGREGAAERTANIGESGFAASLILSLI